LHWIVVPGTFVLCFLQVWIYWVERPFYEDVMNTLYLVHTGIVFWAQVVFLFCKILQNQVFDGGVHIMFLGAPIVWFIILTQKDDRFNLLI